METQAEMEVLRFFVKILIEYFLPVIATNIIVDYSKMFINRDKQKKYLPVVCVFTSIVVGVIYSLNNGVNDKTFFTQVFYTFTIANLVYNLGIYDMAKGFVLNKTKRIHDKLQTYHKKDKE